MRTIARAVSRGIIRWPIESALASLCWAAEARGLFVPAEGAADAFETVAAIALAVAGAAEHDGALALAAHHGLGGGRMKRG